MSITRMLIALGLAVSSTRADVVVVPGGASGAQELQRALDAAAAGDVLLLEPGDYEQGPEFGVYWIHKGITLLPAPGAGPIVLGPIQVSGVPGGQTVVLRGLTIHNIRNGTAPCLDMWGFPGGPAWTVWVEDCTIVGNKGSSLYVEPVTGGLAAQVWQTRAVFRHCTLIGGPGRDTGSGVFATAGGNALNVLAYSEAAVHDCTLVGGAGGNGAPWLEPDAPNGGHAVATTYSSVWLSDCSLTGGQEGADNDAQPAKSGSAYLGPFFHSYVAVQQCVLQPGGVQGAGTQAPAVNDPANTMHLVSEPARSLTLPSIVLDGNPATMLLDGEPGDFAWLLLSFQAAPLTMPRFEGMLELSPIGLAGPAQIGVLSGPEGQLSLPFSLTVPPGHDGITLFAQGLFADADGASLGSGSAITWLDGP